VAALVLEHGGDEDQAIAALLHDAVEDHPREGRTSAEILERFGERVHRMVIAMTDSDPNAADDDAKGPWHDRKQAYLQHLSEAPAEVLLVAAADKLHNARTVYEDYREDGDAIWSRFTAGRDDQLWYYRQLVSTLRDAPAGSPERLVDELTRTVGSLETLIASPRADW
jgi:(p)ppGpp synthase/HD superfamily hydrolase